MNRIALMVIQVHATCEHVHMSLLVFITGVG